MGDNNTLSCDFVATISSNACLVKRFALFMDNVRQKNPALYQTTMSSLMDAYEHMLSRPADAATKQTLQFVEYILRWLDDDLLMMFNRGGFPQKLIRGARLDEESGATGNQCIS